MTPAIARTPNRRARCARMLFLPVRGPGAWFDRRPYRTVEAESKHGEGHGIHPADIRAALPRDALRRRRARLVPRRGRRHARAHPGATRGMVRGMGSPRRPASLLVRRRLLRDRAAVVPRLFDLR